MPQPTTAELCPQCGHAMITARHPGQIRFGCGEMINISEDGKRMWGTYTCETVPRKMPTMEEALAQAVNAFLNNTTNLKTLTPVLLSALDAWPGNYQYLPRQRNALMLMHRHLLARVNEAEHHLTLTAFGLAVARVIAEKEPK